MEICGEEVEKYTEKLSLKKGCERRTQGRGGGLEGKQSCWK